MSEHVTKIVLLGDSNTGKTCIAYRFVQGNNIPNNVESTIGACFFTATVDFPQLSTEVHLWDTAGNIVYRTLVPMYLRNSNILIFVFDVTNISTFQSIPGFLRTCQPSIDPNCPPLFVLVGNKCDANPNDRQVSYEEGLEMAGTLGAEYYEVSALDGYGIIDLFTFSCYQDLVNQGISVTRPIQRDVQPRPQTQTQTQPRETTTTVTSNQPPQEPQPSDQLPLEPPQPTAEPPPEIVPAQTQQFLDSGPSLRNARALQCALIYTNSKSKNKISYINGPQITPISCTCSASHFIVLDTHHICYGFGNNRNHQIDPILPTTIPQFTKITIPDNCTVREVCTCKTFTAFILNDGRLLIHGNANEVENKSIFSGYKSPRGLSSYGNMIIFAHKTGSIICWNDKVRTKRKIEGYNVIDTKLNSQSMIALTGDGKRMNSEMKELKVSVVGNRTVGKTSLIATYASGHFPTDWSFSIFVPHDNETKVVRYNKNFYKLNICDNCQGAEEYRKLYPLTYPDTDVFILCFSLVCRKSLETILNDWSLEIKQCCPSTPFVLVGTKVDLRDNFTVDHQKYCYEPISSQEGMSAVEKIGAYGYVECSSLSGYNLKEVFQLATKAALKIGISNAKVKKAKREKEVCKMF
ncbi:Rho GTPase [Histomonas meleagridis]|uniref:Rho GTPase n=1 Tax=Histomonas meleagridis TaxID=135588 RepID=UPI003559585E|nr:Rho GTPase [Histomonas meleagridis]KAH0804565.1 Rho GTPase [Histomonas meleagridis]